MTEVTPSRCLRTKARVGDAAAAPRAGSPGHALPCVSHLPAGRTRATYARSVPPQDPVTRINAVANDLARLADELGDYAGPDARKLLLHWRHELIEAVADVQRMTQPPARA